MDQYETDYSIILLLHRYEKNITKTMMARREEGVIQINIYLAWTAYISKNDNFI